MQGHSKKHSRQQDLAAHDCSGDSQNGENKCTHICHCILGVRDFSSCILDPEDSVRPCISSWKMKNYSEVLFFFLLIKFYFLNRFLPCKFLYVQVYLKCRWKYPYIFIFSLCLANSNLDSDQAKKGTEQTLTSPETWGSCGCQKNPLSSATGWLKPTSLSTS